MDTYEVKDGRITQTRALDTGNTVTFLAESVRKERTGTHATITIAIGTTVLAWSHFNVERDEDRNRLAKSAHSHFGDAIGVAYPLSNLKHDLDLFSRGLWDASLGTYSPTLVEGNPDAPPATFLVNGFVVRNGGTILFASPGRGKSYVSMLMAVSVDAGVSSLWKVERARTLTVNLERSGESLSQRLARVNRVLGLDPHCPLYMLNARGRSLQDIEASAERFIRDEGIEFLVLDSISRGGFGDLVADRTATTIVDTLNRLCPTWLAIAHTPRADESHVYGSVHFEAGEDVGVRLASQQVDGTLGVALEVVKANDFKPPPPYFLALQFGEDGLEFVRRAQPSEFPELTTGKPPNMKQLAKDYLLSVGDATATQTADALGLNRSNVSAMFAQDSDFVKVRTERRSVYYGVKTNAS